MSRHNQTRCWYQIKIDGVGNIKLEIELNLANEQLTFIISSTTYQIKPKIQQEHGTE
jgi:hypothetical protein